MNTPDPPFRVALRDELVGAAQRRSTGRRFVLGAPGLAAAGAVLLVIVAAVVFGTQPREARADVRIDVEGGRITVTLVDLELRPEEIESAVRAAGLDVSVDAVPVGPSKVGRFVGSTSSDPSPEFELVDARDSSFAGFSLPVGWPDKVRLEVGRPARAGEEYGAFSNAFARGEPLACTELNGAPAHQAVDEVGALDLDVRVQAHQANGTQEVDPASIDSGPFRDWPVVEAVAFSADELLLVVSISPQAPEPNPPPEDPSC